MRLNTVVKVRKAAWVLKSKEIRKAAADWRGYVRCYTCNKIGMWDDANMHAGHFKHGHNPGTYLLNKNLRVQCYRCNVRLSGNLAVYGTKLNREDPKVLDEIDLLFSREPTVYTIITIREAYTELYENQEDLKNDLDA